MPANPDLPESRAEAMTARAGMVREILDVPSMMQNKPLRWFIILLVMMIFAMSGMALLYFQRQLTAMSTENLALRDRLTDYLVTANNGTLGALNRCTEALNDNARVTRRVEQLLDRLSTKNP